MKITKAVKNTAHKVGEYPLQLIGKSNQVINIGQFALIPLNELAYPGLNRRKYKQHVKVFVGKIEDMGFLDALKIFAKKNKNKYYPAEGSHRLEALFEIFGYDSNVLIPCLILPDEYDINDEETTLETMVLFNKDNKPWTVLDYVNGWAKIGKKEYKTLLDYIHLNRSRSKTSQSNKSGLTVPLTIYLYCGGRPSESYKKLREGKMFVKPKNRRYIDVLNSTFANWSEDFGSKNDEFHTTYATHMVNSIWSYIEGLIEEGGDEDEILLYVESFLNYMDESFRVHFKSKKIRPSSTINFPVQYDLMEADFNDYVEGYEKENSRPKSTFWTTSKSKTGQPAVA